MGLFSDMKAAADVQRIKNGGTANLSISQITCLIVNMPDARRNLEAAQFEKVYALYGKLRKCKTKIELDINGYYDTSAKIIVSFNRIAPYEKFSGMNEIEAKLLLAEIEQLYGDEGIDINLNSDEEGKNRDAKGMESYYSILGINEKSRKGWLQEFESKYPKAAELKEQFRTAESSLQSLRESAKMARESMKDLTVEDIEDQYTSGLITRERRDRTINAYRSCQVFLENEKSVNATTEKLFSQIKAELSEYVIEFLKSKKAETKRGSIGGKIAGIAVAVVVIAFLCLCFYVHNVSSYFNVEDSVYYAANDSTEIYYHFAEDNTLEMIYSAEYKNYVGKVVYTYSGSYWNHLFGNLYFSGKSMLSLKNVESGAHPATVNMICEENFCLDPSNGEIEKYANQELIGQIFTYEFMFYDDYMTVDGTLFTKVDEVNPVYAELIRLSDYF